jgi:signal transduction histidine kinase
MDYNLLANLQYCKDIVDGLRSFILYSHIPSAVVTLVVSGFILYKTKSLAGKILFALAVTFSLWIGLDLSIWFFYGRASSLMAAWSMLGILSDIIFVLIFYFVYVLVLEKRMPNWMFIAWGIVLAPAVFFAATNFNLQGYDIRDCVALENTLYTNYYYGVGMLVFILLPIVGYAGWRRKSENRAGVSMVIVGAELFILSFLTTGVIAQYLVDNNIIPDFGLEQYGIMAMAVFMVFLAYVIVKYQQFKIQLIATQALVIAIVILIAAEFTLTQGTVGYVLVGVTLALAAITGIALIRSVKKEISLREHIEQLAGELQKTNERQENLIHFIGHEVKGFLTKAQGAFAALVEGDFGTVPAETIPFVERALAETRNGVDSVSAILKAANLKKGTVAYDKKPFDLKALVEKAVDSAKQGAEQKGLVLTLVTDAETYQMTGDAPQINDHVLRNLIDNSINYTPTGSVTVSLKKVGSTYVFAVKDTGVGVTDEDKVRLFTEGGHGKESIKVNVHSTGYGLFIAKQITEAHGGTIRAESEGAGKGSTFIVEFPAV